MKRDVLPYWPVSLGEVGQDAWPFVMHLNELYRRGRYFDRVWNQVKWIHPFQRGFIQTAELKKIADSSCIPPVPVFSAFFHAQWIKNRADLDVSRYLSDALACVAPRLFDERSRLFEGLADKYEDPWLAPENPNQTGLLNVSAFLFAVESVHFVFAKRSLEIEQLRAGHHLALWRADMQKLGAKVGGLRSAEARQAMRKGDPAKIVRDAEALIQAGQDKRYVAGIIAARIGVGSDYVRKILRDSKKPN